MTRSGWLVCAVAVVVGLGGCQPGGEETGPQTIQAGESYRSPSTRMGKVREPAVAGIFYPRDRETLARQVDRHLADAKPATVENLRAMICPHAGYDFSGPVAATAYRLLKGRQVDTVIVAAPSHYADFEGASIPDVDAYQTPLGDVRLSPRAKKLVDVDPLVSDPRCRVERPGWWRQASKELPPFGEDTPHTWEHSLEVQLPFLQQTLEGFAIVPIVLGRVDPKRMAEALQTVLDEKTILVASSDLSHYHPYDVACELDAATTKAICDLDVAWFETGDASPSEAPCGKLPVLALMHLAQKNGWRAKLLDYRNSGDTSGDKSAVVGYAAIVFFEPEEGEQPEDAPSENSAKSPSGTSAPHFTPQEGQILLELASKAVAEAVAVGAKPSVDSVDVPKSLTEPRACFVTLTKGGELRGCIGSIFPGEPLCQAVVARARSAATEDPRFPPVAKEELAALEIEVSVLTIPERLEHESADDLVGKLRPHVDGVVLRVGGRQATYLPQVWEQLSDAKTFLTQLSLKAGLPPDTWRSPQATVLTYQVEAFKQREM